MARPGPALPRPARPFTSRAVPALLVLFAMAVAQAAPGAEPSIEDIAATGDAAPPSLPAAPGPAPGPGPDAVAGEPGQVDFFDLSLEQLMSIQVTSVAGTGQDWFKTPAALYVLTARDIQRSGHRSIAEALRMVPGVNVGRVDSRQWAISTRGFGALFANKQLVLIDGRVVYDQLFSGVFWDVQDPLLEDIDRIEVVRGPGATLWGANAVNGVINITTKSARETQGLFLSGGIGDEERGFGEFRYGGRIGEDAWYRVWGRHFDRHSFERPDGTDRPDDWDLTSGGFRVDVDGDTGTILTVQGDGYNSDHLGEGISVPVPGHLTRATIAGDGRADGGNVLARLSREDADSGNGWSLQSYHAFENRKIEAGFLTERDTIDLDWRQHFRLGNIHALLWGMGYRYQTSDTEATATVAFSPEDRTTNLFTGFVQDTITLVPDRLALLIGSKFEHNDFTGFEIQPSARLSWTPDDRQTIWAAVSRPVRTPSLAADDVVLTAAFADTGLLSGGPPSGIFVPLTVTGDRDLDSEELTAWEAGYRVKVSQRLMIDTAAFYNDYRKIIGAPTTGVGAFANSASADSYGVEVAATWQAADNWRIESSYSFLKVDVDGDVRIDILGDAPRNQFQIRSYLDLSKDLELNAGLYYNDNVPAYDADAYLRLDVGVTWRPAVHVELSVVAQNLLDPSHRESNDVLFQDSPTEIERSVLFIATLRY